MTRATLSSANRTQASSSALRLALLVELNFPSSTVRVTTGGVATTFNGNTFSSAPLLTDHDGFQEQSTLKANRSVLKFSGLDSGLISKILTDKYHFAPVNIWLGFFDASWSLIDTPYVVADSLLMSAADIVLDVTNGVIELSCEGYEIFNQRDAAVLATPQAQQLRYPGDTGMNRAKSILEEEVKWGGVISRTSDPGG